jgi:subtilisin family serine protease
LEAFSSSGATPSLFDTLGNRLATPDLRSHKPEIVAPDGIDTTFFGSDTDGNGFPNFFGTSAAAPHAAGIAALLFQVRPKLSRAKIYTRLENSAIDMSAPGFDNDTGFGLIQADGSLFDHQMKGRRW